MNTQTLITRNTLRGLAVASLLAASFGAQASDSLAQRVATGVGRVIAAQGNAALIQIREDFRAQLPDALRETLEPVLPEARPAGQAAAATPGIALE
ncbi:MAG TPA: hypothetical protein VFV11_07460 [Solimonas sp.]|nr:hypothetical protein [Solimonas sp.]